MIGIVLLNYNNYEDTMKCISSIKKHTLLPYKIYLIDNASPDNSYYKLKEKFNNENKIRLILARVNKGYSTGNNLGIKEAIKDEADAILIINPDVILINDAISKMYDAMNLNLNIAVVGPSIKSPSENEAQFARPKLTYFDFLFSKKPLLYIKTLKQKSNRFYNWQESNNDIFVFSGMVSGCCFLINTKVFLECRLLDENIFLYHEEDILAHKLEVLGYKTAIQKNARILHNHHSSISKNGNSFSKFYQWWSALYVLRAYAGVKGIKMILLILANIVTWFLMSLQNKHYRVRLLEFTRDNLNLLKFHPGLKLKAFRIKNS